jgi:hypothetical protein
VCSIIFSLRPRDYTHDLGKTCYSSICLYLLYMSSHTRATRMCLYVVIDDIMTWRAARPWSTQPRAPPRSKDVRDQRKMKTPLVFFCIFFINSPLMRGSKWKWDRGRWSCTKYLTNPRSTVQCAAALRWIQVKIGFRFTFSSGGAFFKLGP